MTPPTTITRALHDYLTDWLAWVDRGAPDGEPYDRGAGLCVNAPTDEIDDELDAAFNDKLFPFNGDEPLRYHRDILSRTMHLNEARLAWARETIQTAEIEG